MKTYVFLLLFGFIHLVFCDCNSGLNVTDYESYPVCPVHLFRRKRSNTEYTRWRANQDLTTNEFLVKVLDEDLTTPQKVKIVAVNIQPVTEGGEKIIIGGARVLPPTTQLALSTADSLKDYTRFAIPPIIDKTRAGDLYHAPVPPPQVTYPPILPPVQSKGVSVNRNAQRDDSPPASPQFLARTPTLTGRQYAPIAPVAFNRRLGLAPVTPSTKHTIEEKFETLQFIPVRTTPYPDIPSRTTSYPDIPTRTTPYPAIPTRRTDPDEEEFQTINSFDEDSPPVSFREETTPTTYSVPDRTITMGEINMMNDVDVDIEVAAEQKPIVEGGRRREEELKKVAEKESSYNMMFYNDEDTVNANSKKDDLDISDINIEISTEIVSSDSTAKEIEDDFEFKKPAHIKGLLISPDEYSSNNSASQLSPVGVIGIPDGEINELKETKDTYRDKRRPFCSLLKLRPLNFNSPRTLPEIMSQLKQWAEVSPVVKWLDITEGNFTTMENPIYMMIVDDPSSGQIVSAKQTVMIVAGIQGRDHHAVTAAMYVLYQLIERSEAHTDLLSKYRFWIIPVFNPDGYDYSMTFPQRREWTKNLRQLWETCRDDTCKSCEDHGLQCLIQPCYGVNLDRNFEYQWIPAEELRSDNPCGKLYSGVRQLSEPETYAITQFMDKQHTPLYTFIAFKEGNTLGVMYPYSHTKNKRAFDHVYRIRAERAAAAANSISNRPYVAGQTSEFLPLFAGGIEDWMDSHLGIDNTYTIVLFRPSDSYKTQFITERVVHEAYAATDTLLLQSAENVPEVPVALKRQEMRRNTNMALTLCPTHSLTIVPVVALLYG